MELVTLRTVDSKHLEALVHSARSTYRALRQEYDIIHYHAIGPGVFSFAPRLLGSAKVVQTIHGLDGDRAKWGWAARTLLRSATWGSAHVPDSTIVVSETLATYYAERYGRSTLYIPNGVTVAAPDAPPGALLERLGTEAGRYVTFVGRLVPEKRPDLLLRAFRRVRGDWKLVIAGGASHTDQYVRQLEGLASLDDRVRMAGYVYGSERDELYANAALFALPSSLEGLPLTLLEAIAAGVPVIASDIGPHCEVLTRSQPGGRLFTNQDEDALVRALQTSLDNLDVEQLGARSLSATVLPRYNWDVVTDQLEAEYRRLTSAELAPKIEEPALGPLPSLLPHSSHHSA
jgi:glycosyltransferase involved in cell wall biosynthesis